MNLKKKPILRGESLAEQIMSQQENLTEDDAGQIAFFLGAGASIEAGVPDTFTFVAEFIAAISGKEKEQVEQLVKLLQEWGNTQSTPRKVDIELLLQALQTLSNKDQELIIPFIDNPQLKLPSIDSAALLKLLRNFIKERVIVESDRVKYLEPLRAFLQEFGPLDIYSANYDTCIELFCSEHKLNYKDGFDEAWNPKVFNDRNIDIRLFKIHGSVTWYQSDRGRFLKIPLRTKVDDVELITKERASGLMLYPAQKFEYVEPLFELLMLMKDRLDKCEILFVVGYSFRDDHIRRIFWDVARKNKEFRIVLIGPDAWSTYQNRLKYYDDGKTSSSLAEKVFCLPYKFEKVLHALINEFLPSISASLTCVSKTTSREIAGYFVQWEDCVVNIAKAGDIEKLKTIVDKIKIDQLNRDKYGELVESVAIGIFYALANEDDSTIPLLWRRFNELLLLISDKIEVSINSVGASINFSPSSHDKISLYDIFSHVKNTRDAAQTRIKWTKDSEKLQAYLAFLNEFNDIFLIWPQGTSFQNYQQSRPCSIDLLANLELISGSSETVKDSIDRAPLIKRDVAEVEKNEIKKILDKYNSKIV